MAKESTSIEQLNLGFNKPEDRLLLKVGMSDQSEIQLWITRRVCKELWHLLQNSHGQVLESLKEAPKAKARRINEKLAAPKLVKPLSEKEQSIADFANEAELHKSLEVMDFSAEYLSNRSALADAPMLVVECCLATQDKHITRLNFKSQAGESVKMGLTIELVVAMTNMMQLATREAGWDLLMLQNTAVKNRQQSNDHVIH